MSRGSEQEGRGWAPASAPSGHVDDWDELVVDYLNGRLASETKVAVELHLQECPDCAARVQTQHRVVTLLQEASLDDPPEDLEQRVLGEILFPSQPVLRPQVEEPSRWSKVWRRKVRPWIPATVAVAALLGAVVGYGLVRSNADLSTEGRQAGTTIASQDNLAGAVPSQSESLGVTSTVMAAATATTAAAAFTTASASGVPAVTQDKKTMVSNLKAAQAPAYVAFEVLAPQAPGDGEPVEPTTTLPGDAAAADASAAVSPEQVDAVVSQMIAFTGMEPLDPTLSLGGPTFAAFVPRDDVAQLVDLVRSIGASVRLTVSLGMEPPATASGVATRLLEHRAELPVLSADRVPQPAVSGYAFTTSTLAPAGGSPDGTLAQLPDDAGTHVLIVFYIRR
ncbi:MAG: zf-HC2 domain-containing protein [bacterium]